MQPVNLNSLMVDALSLVDHQFKKSQVDISLDLDPSLPPDSWERWPAPAGFHESDRECQGCDAEGRTAADAKLSQDSTLVVKVQDTGNGISPEDVKRIYDPFFTTKAVGKGTGLGLSVSYGIIQEHSGRISVESHPGKGTTFTLQLPLRRLNCLKALTANG